MNRMFPSLFYCCTSLYGCTDADKFEKAALNGAAPPHEQGGSSQSKGIGAGLGWGLCLHVRGIVTKLGSAGGD